MKGDNKMKSKLKKDCYHCLHIRPNKNNRCVIKQIVIQEPHTFCCDSFLMDTYVIQDEKSLDEPYEQKNLFLEVFCFSPQCVIYILYPNVTSYHL
jgi:hypothetical protein